MSSDSGIIPPEVEWIRSPGELFWEAGQDGIVPLRIRHGVVAYRSGSAAIGLLGPGQVALPIPGLPSQGPAATELIAVTDTVAVSVEIDALVAGRELTHSTFAIIEGAHRLGNMTLAQRLAAVLLDLSEWTGQSVIGVRQDILAMAAAARRETVATVLSSWREEKWIQTRYRRCKVLNREALERIRDRRGRATGG
jgi:CRP-like cAMP-binding protein